MLTWNSTKHANEPRVPRYAAELIAPLLGRRAVRESSEFIRLTTRVQDTLGAHQDALITMGELEAALSKHGDNSAFVECAGLLLEDQRERACATRAQFFKVWSKLDRKKLRRWMKPRHHARSRLTAVSEPIDHKLSHI